MSVDKKVMFLNAWKLCYPGLPEPQPEYKFHPTRKWKADWAFPRAKVLIEVEGGTRSGGRHTRGDGYQNDCEKYNAATALGFRVLRFTTEMLKNDGPWCCDLVVDCIDLGAANYGN